jgi:predicted transcriptional regulator
MTESPMALIRKLDETAAALLELAKHIRRTALEVADDALRAEMLASAEGLERRAGEMGEAVGRLRTKIN